jgi:hypothetical protein
MTEETTQAVTPAPDAVPAPQEVESSTTPVAPEAAAAETGTKDENKEVLSPVQRRFDKLTWEKNQEAREKEYWRNQALKPKEEPETPKQVPTLAQFEYDETKYQAALVEWTRAEARKEAIEAVKAEKAKERDEARVTSFKTREADFISKTPDYQEKVYDPSVPISPTMVELIAESPDGPALAYHLANNVELARQIANLPPLAAAREMGRIEAKLSQPKAVPVVSKAPAPPPKIDAVEPEVSKDPSNMTDKEFATWRRRQIAQRRNR